MTAAAHLALVGAEPAEADAVSSTELVELTGVSYRRIDHWSRTDRLRTTTWDGHRNKAFGHGFPRSFPRSEVPVVALVGRMNALGLDLDLAFKAARSMVGDGINLVVLPGNLAIVDLSALFAVGRVRS